ncbi:PorV/PorQ family protein [bacterium]|nr:PorV/PorQ family protein [bacterium]
MSRTRTTVVSLVVLSLLLVSTASAQNFADAWRTRILGAGAKAMAMGTAYTAFAQDATAAYWNPAALATLRQFEASLMYTAGMRAERNYNYVSAALRVDRVGTFGLSWINAGTTGIPTRATNTPDPTGSLDWSTNAFQLSYGRELASGFALGLSGKYLQEDLADNTGYGVDAGMLFRPYDEIQVGAMVRDLSGKHGKDDAPWEARLGLGVMPWKHLWLSTDLVGAQDQDVTLAIGTAYHVDVSDKTTFYIAAGFNDLLKANDNETTGFSSGFGIGFKNFEVQYAYVTEANQVFEENHRISANFFFKEKNPLKSLMGSLKRKPREAEPAMQPEGPKEFIHRYIFEGNPSLKLSLEILRPEQKDSIKQVWSEAGGVVSFPGVNFAVGSAEITDEFARVLDGAAQLVAEHPEIQLLEVQGHTDNTGTDAINDPLSQARADAVRNYLVSRGVDSSRLVAKGFGSKKAVASNATEQGRYQNRRIDIVRIR